MLKSEAMDVDDNDETVNKLKQDIVVIATGDDCTILLLINYITSFNPGAEV